MQYCYLKKITQRSCTSCILALFFLLALAGRLPAQKPSAITFPQDWTGNWAGTLRIYNAKGLADTVRMQLEIHPIDTSAEGRYTFGIVYGSKEKDWRPYELVPVAPERGLWQVDEKNSIVIESFLYGPKFMSWFVVLGNRLLCTYERVDADTLLFEVYSGLDRPVSTTGNTKREGEEIPEVQTFPFAVFQRAILKRQP